MPLRPDRWSWLRQRLKDTARLPIIALVIVCSALLAWLGCWYAWRWAEYLFDKYLKESWI